MESLFLLIPFSVMLALAIIGLLGWAINSDQFDDLDIEAERILHED
jgi:cbb3-type cytochrome oxidase maturation protein